MVKTKDAVDLALASYRSPLEYRTRFVASIPLPIGMSRLLRLANHSQTVLKEASQQTGAGPDELCDAARFLIQQLCFARGADHYRVLGLEPNAPLEQVKEHYHQLMRLFHPDRTAGRETWTEHFASRVNEAWTVLSRSEARACYDTQLYQPRPPDPPQCSVTEPADASRRTTDIRPQQIKYSSHAESRIQSFRHWRSATILTGIALAGGALLIWVDYPDLASQASLRYHRKAPIVEVSAVPNQKPGVEQTARSAISLLLTAPDWKAISQREFQTRQQSDRARAVQPQIQPVDQPVKAAGEVQMKQESAEQSRLEHLLQLEQTERMRIEKEIKAEQAWREHIAAERLRQERLHADLDQAERMRIEKEIKADLHRQELAIEYERGRLLDQTREKPARNPEQKSKTLHELPGIESGQPALAPVKVPPSPHPAPATIATLPKSAPGDDANLTDREAKKLVDRYVTAYQHGDLHTVMSLYATDVQVNGNNYGAIRRNFASFFEDQVIQRLELENRQWDHRGDVARLKARYKLSLKRRDTGKLHESTGNIQFVLRKQNGRVSIQAMDFDWVKN